MSPVTTQQRTDHRAPAVAPQGSRGVRLAAAALAAVVALIHLVEGPEYLESTAYIGVLFVVGGVTLLAVSGALAAGRFTAPAWTLGALVCAGMVVGGVLSRTTGLPSFKEEEWEPLLILSIVLELGFLALWVPASRDRARSPR